MDNNRKDIIRARIRRKKRLLEETFEVRLNDAPLFCKHLDLLESYHDLAIELFKELTDFPITGKIGNNRIKAFKILVANLLSFQGNMVKTPLAKGFWNKCRYYPAYQFVREIIPTLKEKGYIEMAKGYRLPNGESRHTRIGPTKKLINRFPLEGRGLFNKIDPGVFETEPYEVVVMRDKEKSDIDYIDNRWSNQVRKTLKTINSINSSATILDHRNRRVSIFLRAIYNNGSFTKGGRFYTSGFNSYQLMSKENRLLITINGEEITELDYSALHPRMLYAKEGIQYPIENDCYYIENEPNLRLILKKVAVAMIGSDSKKTAIKGINLQRRENRHFHMLMKRYNLKAQDAMVLFEEKHKLIKKYFYQGLAFELQNRDSKLMLGILKYFANRKIPCLPLHDSVLIQKKYGPELYDVMDHSFRKMHSGFVCPIKSAYVI